MKPLKEISTRFGLISIIEYSRDYTGRVIALYESFDDRVLDFGIPPYDHGRIRRTLSLHGNTGRVFLAISPENRVVGLLIVHRFTDSRRNHICEFFIYIHQDYHDLGIGTELLSIMINWAEKQGIKKIKLGVFADNYRAIHLYKKLGFYEESRFEKELQRKGEYIDEIFMSRWIGEID